MFNWFKKEKIISENTHNIEDLSRVRNLTEKLAEIKLGNAFGVTTREGVRIFKYIELRKVQK